jgi:hypothetical protein
MDRRETLRMKLLDAIEKFEKRLGYLEGAEVKSSHYHRLPYFFIISLFFFFYFFFSGTNSSHVYSQLYSFVIIFGILTGIQNNIERGIKKNILMDKYKKTSYEQE